MKMIDSSGYGLPGVSSFEVLARPALSALGRWRWHHGALVKLRERLLKQRAELAAAILEPVDPLNSDIADNAADELDHDLALALLSAEQDTLFEIEAALGRIRTGTYGRCEVTGKAISSARLRAVPWTRFCRAIEEQLEQEGECRRPHLGELRSVHHTVALDYPPSADKSREEAV